MTSDHAMGHFQIAAKPWFQIEAKCKAIVVKLIISIKIFRVASFRRWEFWNSDVQLKMMKYLNWWNKMYYGQFEER